MDDYKRTRNKINNHIYTDLFTKSKYMYETCSLCNYFFNLTEMFNCYYIVHNTYSLCVFELVEGDLH